MPAPVSTGTFKFFGFEYGPIEVLSSGPQNTGTFRYFGFGYGPTPFLIHSGSAIGGRRTYSPMQLRVGERKIWWG